MNGEPEFWWSGSDHDRAQRMLGMFRRIRLQNSERRTAMVRHMRLYGNYSRTLGGDLGLSPDRLRYNIIAQAIDTSLAEVTAQRPKVAYVTSGGEWSLRQSAKALEQLTEGQMRAEGLYAEKGYAWVRDAAALGTGLLKIRNDWAGMKPRIDRVLPLEVEVDDADARYGEPRGTFQEYLIDRQVLAARFHKHRDTILNETMVPRFNPMGEADEWFIDQAGESDLVRVVEAWRVPSHTGAGDGRHMVAVEGAAGGSNGGALDLWSDKWVDPCSPIVALRWEPAPLGYWGVGLAERLQPDQIELNFLLMKLQDTMGAAAGVWLVEEGSNVKPSHITEIPGTVIDYTGTPPQFYAPNTVAPEMFAQINNLIGRALGREGISETLSTGNKPAGLQSGEGLKVVRDIGSARQNPKMVRLENAWVDLARVMGQHNARLAKGPPKGVVVKADKDQKEASALALVKRGRRQVLKRIRWKDARLPENEYVMQAHPQSALPNHPAGRRDTIEGWYQSGLLTPEEFKSLVDMPDMDVHTDLSLADFDYALYAFEKMVEDGKAVAPDPNTRLEVQMELIRSAYVRAKMDGAPDARLRLVRNHLSAIKRLIEKRDGAAQAPADPEAAALEAGAMPDAAAAALPAPDMAGAIDPTQMLPPGIGQA